jgi:hypothetical protein
MGNAIKSLQGLVELLALPVTAASDWSASYADQLRRQALARMQPDDPAREWLTREIAEAARRRRRPAL